MVFYSDQASHQPFKVSIFSRIHELKGVIEELNQVAALSKSKRVLWLNENEVLLQTYLDEFAGHATMEVTMTDMDYELSQLLIEYTGQLQELMRVIHGIFSAKKIH